jgi:hypothetical protein
MSFGFSVGDFVGAANLTYKLITALREHQDTGEEYHAAIDELNCYQTALMRVGYLARKKIVPRDTFDAASHIVMQSMEIIQSHLEQTKKYDQKLGRTGVSGARQSLMRARWTLYKSDDMKKLRDSLQRRNASLQLLLQCAGLYVNSRLLRRTPLMTVAQGDRECDCTAHQRCQGARQLDQTYGKATCPVQ